MTSSALLSEVQYLPGVGPKRAALLRSELGVGTVGELIRLYPFRYIDRSTIHRIADIVPDMAYVQILARVESVSLYTGAGRAADPASMKSSPIKRMSVLVSDASGQIELTFFKGIRWMSTKLKPGSVFLFFGKPSVFNGRLISFQCLVDVGINVLRVREILENIVFDVFLNCLTGLICRDARDCARAVKVHE